jgi:hypothetical protein
LKAGVKAGLTLYDIAVMCCRNDNLGEAPSKLEMLFSMAEELANSAIENGRWDHAAASRALAEQLTPKGGSLLNASGGRMVHKSKSALNLPQFSPSLSEFTSGKRKKDHMPNMIQSSASDSSSDSGEGDGVDGEECEEWAAALIADVSMEQSFSLLNVKTRSPSIQSDDSSESGLSSSPKGFWTISPGNLDDGFDDSDSDSVSWGSPPSPDNFYDASLSSFTGEIRRSYNPFDNGRRSSIVLADTSVSQFETFRRSPSKVTFSDCTQPPSEGTPDRRLFKHCNSDVGDASETHFLKRPESKLKRSQSYSALSSTAEKVTKQQEAAAQTKRPLAHELYRDYFLKFVDLVIVRETTAAARQAKAQC